VTILLFRRSVRLGGSFPNRVQKGKRTRASCARAKPAMAKKKPASNFKLNLKANPKQEPGPALQSKARSEEPRCFTLKDTRKRQS
jgi:hypothetical protein